MKEYTKEDASDAGNMGIQESSVTAQTEKTYVCDVPKKDTRQLSVKTKLTAYTAKKKATNQETQNVPGLTKK